MLGISDFLIEKKNSAAIITQLQSIFNLKFSTKLEQSIHEIIVKHAYAAEKLGPGGFTACLEIISRKIASQNLGLQYHEGTVNFKGIVERLADGPTMTDVEAILDEYLGCDDSSKAMLFRALEFAGFGGRIIVEKTRSKSSVELVRGYTFEQRPAWPISVRLERPRIVCIDGFIENVSELHHLLEEAAEAKVQIAMFVRGLSEDVTHTLKVNYDRGSLRVIPIIVRFDLEGLNSINDIAVATGSELISSNKGDLISSIRLSSLASVDEVVVYPTKISITNAASKRGVDSQISFLRNKRLKEENDEIAKLLDERIRSLSPNHVVIRLVDDMNYVAKAQAIDYALRAIRSLIDYGMLNSRLTATVIASEFHAEKCVETLQQLGAVVT